MTEESKQELRQLLPQVMNSLRITSRDGDSISLAEYGKLLRERWTSYSAQSSSVRDFSLSIVIDETTLKILAIFKSELGKFINNERIVAAISYAMGGSSEGGRTNSILTQLLKIAIARGIEQAVLAIDRCTKDTHANMNHVALLEGIKIDEAIQAFDGVRLVPVQDSQSVCQSYLPPRSVSGISEDFFYSHTLLIIDYTISPMFRTPVLPPVFLSEKALFRIEVTDGRFSYFTEFDFFKKFCGALSLACNSPMLISMTWDLLPEDAIFTDGPGPGIARYHIPGLFGKSIDVGKSDIEKAKRLYALLDQNPELWEKVRIPIDRWVKSKAGGQLVDKMIDLGIAFEALYVADGGGDITYRFSIRAARHMGGDKEQRLELLKKFKHIYKCRSKAVHSGQLDQRVKFGEDSIPVSDFIERAQDLCRDSIMKILDAGKFPDWNCLILSGEVD